MASSVNPGGILAGRAAHRIRALAKAVGNARIWVAGGALIREGNDVDIFAPDELPAVPPEARIVSESANATSFLLDGQLYQFCKHKKPTLRELINSFDFAHCQIGCEIVIKDTLPLIAEVAWTENFSASRVAGTTWFVGSEYPLSSLIRVGKYQSSGVMTRGDAVRASIDTLVAVVARGFHGYQDFKDQLDAVDLGLVPEHLEQVERASLARLFDLLNRGEPDTEKPNA